MPIHLIDHESGTYADSGWHFAPDAWTFYDTTALDDAAKAANAIVTPPSGSPKIIGDYAIKKTVTSSTTRYGPFFQLSSPRSQVWGTLRVYIPSEGSNNTAPLVCFASNQRGDKQSFGDPSFNGTDTDYGLSQQGYHGEWGEFGVAIVSGGIGDFVGGGIDSSATGLWHNVKNSRFVVTKDEWHLVNFRFTIVGDSVRCELSVDCQAPSDNTYKHDSATTRYPVNRVFTGSHEMVHYIDNIGLYDEDPVEWPCPPDPFAGKIWTGDEPGTVYPAPEPVPHRFSEIDFPNMPAHTARKIAKMLNENFDSTERQLLALDPDSQDLKQPYR